MNFVNKIIVFSFLIVISRYSLAQSRIQELAATQYKQSVILNFIITPGNACSGYKIEHSIDSLNFELLYDFSGICGELTKSQSISYSHETPLKNKRNYYRVLIPPADYSTISSLVFIDISEKGYILYNNPINQNLLLLSSYTNSKLKIYNQFGELVRKFSPNENGLYYEDITALQSGILYFEIEPKIGKTIFGKFIKL